MHSMLYIYNIQLVFFRTKLLSIIWYIVLKMLPLLYIINN